MDTDFVQIGNISLICGDCLAKMKDIPEKSVDMVLCDLPYGTTSCKWDAVIPFVELWANYRRIVKNNGAIVLFGINPFTSALIQSNLRGFKFSWVWDKKFAANFALKNYQPQRIHEDIVVFTHSGATVFFNPQLQKRLLPIKHGGNKCNAEHVKIRHPKKEYEKKEYEWKQPESIIHISSRSEPRGFHPTQKPVKLLEYLIKTYSNEGDLILDNTMGSGSTMVACVNTKRRGIGIEMNEEYFATARKRVESAMIQPSLF